jgi:hypothetical protein
VIDPRLDDPNDDCVVDGPEDHRRFPVQFLRDYRTKRGIRTVIIHGIDCMREALLATRVNDELLAHGISSSVSRLDPSIRRYDVEITGNYDGRHDSAIVAVVRKAIHSHGANNDSGNS